MHADAKQTEFCTYLSAILRGGLLLNALFGLWRADPAAALVMVPISAKEGGRTTRQGVRRLFRALTGNQASNVRRSGWLFRGKQGLDCL
jgi:hypothetical protein